MNSYVEVMLCILGIILVCFVLSMLSNKSEKNKTIDIFLKYFKR
jgi:hypothetical protein